MYLNPAATTVWKCPTDEPKNILWRTLKKKRQPVRKERLHLESRSKTVDKASVIFKCRPVIELLVVPVGRLITGQSGKPGREEHVLVTVREERHEITYFPSKLCALGIAISL